MSATSAAGPLDLPYGVRFQAMSVRWIHSLLQAIDGALSDTAPQNVFLEESVRGIRGTLVVPVNNLNEFQVIPLAHQPKDSVVRESYFARVAKTDLYSVVRT
jgi:hypothetical protein